MRTYFASKLLKIITSKQELQKDGYEWTIECTSSSPLKSLITRGLSVLDNVGDRYKKWVATRKPG